MQYYLEGLFFTLLIQHEHKLSNLTIDASVFKEEYKPMLYSLIEILSEKDVVAETKIGDETSTSTYSFNQPLNRIELLITSDKKPTERTLYIINNVD